ncbi:hypothetical protein MMPV_004353 [Pyropia vietnamensis]
MEAPAGKPDGSTDRYDRQIRLWGEAGQRRLEAAAVCVVTASATGTETLKNLVLPGIGAFTLVDGTTVTARDYGANFFLTPDAAPVGAPKAAAAVTALGELNAAAVGTARTEELASLLNGDGEGGPALDNADGDAAAASFVSAFTVVVATQMGEGHPALRRLARACWTTGVPLVVARAYGLYGLVRVVASPEATVLDARDGSADDGMDLRVAAPWPELSALAAATDLDALDDTAFAHVPAVVLLLKALASWAEAEGGGGVPPTAAGRAAFKKRLAGLRRPSVRDADNFDEAARPAHIRAAADPAAGVPSLVVEAVLAHPRADPARDERPAVGGGGPHPRPPLRGRAGTPPSGDTSAALYDGWASGADALAADAASFWLHAAALREFVAANDGRLPLAGALPDMTSDTASYVALQTVYSDRARADAEQVAAAAAALAPRRPVAAARRRPPSAVRGRSVDAGWGSNTTQPVLPAWDEASVKAFCRHAAAVRVLRYRSLDDEWCTAARGGPDGAAVTDGGSPAARIEGGFPLAAYTSAGYTGTVGGVFAGGDSGERFGSPDGACDTGAAAAAAVAAASPALPSGLPAFYEANAGDGASPSAVSIYVLLRAADRFYGQHGRYPGEDVYGGLDGVDVDGDAGLMRDLAAGVRAEVGLPPAAVDDGDVVEVVRAAAAELHPVAALVGGLAAQEVMKLVTKQFVPVNNTVVINLMTGTTESFEA